MLSILIWNLNINFKNMEKLVVMVGLKQPGNNIQLLGSCFAVPKNGYFVTCRHVIGVGCLPFSCEY